MCDNNTYDTIVVGGGGTKGLNMLGILHYYWEKGNLDNIKYYSGTSIGSILVTLMNCGYKPMEIFTWVYSQESLFDLKASNISMWTLITQKYGLMSIDVIKSKIKPMILAKLEYIPTFRELYEATKCELHITVTNVTQKREVFLSYKNYPDMSVLDAIGMSCAIPGLFSKIEFEGEVYLDGGLLNNLPIEPVYALERQILSIMAYTADDIPREGIVEGIIDYAHSLLLLPIVQVTELKLEKFREKSNCKIVEIFFQNISIIEFAMTSQRKMQLFMRGYNETKQQENVEFLHIKGLSFGSTSYLEDEFENSTKWDGTEWIDF